VYALGAAAACLLLTRIGCGPIPCRYEFAAIIKAPDCGVLGEAPTIAAAMDSRGDVCGFYYQGSFIHDEAFVWVGPSPGRFVTIPRPPGVVSTYALNLSDSGLVCDSWWRGNGFDIQRGFTYDLKTGSFAGLEPLPRGQRCSVASLTSSFWHTCPIV
jgi:hypothetical protein